MHMEQAYKQWNNEKKSLSSPIQKTNYLNDSYLRLFGKRQWTLYEQFFLNKAKAA